MIYCSIGERIMLFRKRKKLSRKRLAEIAGISYATLSNYERGKTTPSAKIIVKLAFALQVSANDLISIDDSKKSGISPMSLRLDSDIMFSKYRKLLDECNYILENRKITMK